MEEALPDVGPAIIKAVDDKIRPVNDDDSNHENIIPLGDGQIPRVEAPHQALIIAADDDNNDKDDQTPNVVDLDNHLAPMPHQNDEDADPPNDDDKEPDTTLRQSSQKTKGKQQTSWYDEEYVHISVDLKEDKMSFQ